MNPVNICSIAGGIALALFAAYALWSVIQSLRADSRRLAVQREQLPKLGFFMLDPAEPELNERILRFFPWASRPRAVRRAWMRDDPECRLYVVDWEGTSGFGGEGQGGGSTQVGDCVFVVSPSLRLPRFRIHPKVDLSGLLPGLFRRWQQHVEKRLGGPVKLDDMPAEFDQRYTVTGEDAAAIHQVLKAPQLRQIGQLKHRVLEAGGDMFSYMRREPEFPGRVPKQPEILALLEEARILHDMFTRGHRAVQD
jgi:hypothetical protein